MLDRFTPTLTALDLAFQGAHFTEKMAGMQAVEHVLALERACSAFEILGTAARANPWVKELNFQWRKKSSYNSLPTLKITPSLAEPHDLDSRLRTHLSTLIDFAIASTHLADGTVGKDLVSYASNRDNHDAVRDCFILASHEPSFSGRAASAFKAQLDMAELELSRALVWAFGVNVSWMPRDTLLDRNWEKSANGSVILSSQEMSLLVAGPALAAEIERRELVVSAPQPRHVSARRVL